jgi:hypothetical protein
MGDIIDYCEQDRDNRSTVDCTALYSLVALFAPDIGRTDLMSLTPDAVKPRAAAFFGLCSCCCLIYDLMSRTS